MNLTITTLPAFKAPLANGIFAGVTTRPDGTHCAVVLLPKHGTKLTWDKAVAWATEQGGELPSRPVAALLFSNVKDQLKSGWHWTSEQDEDNASSAWDCLFRHGHQTIIHKCFEGCAVAVRLIPITA